jgi:hypothetical protein
MHRERVLEGVELVELVDASDVLARQASSGLRADLFNG